MKMYPFYRRMDSNPHQMNPMSYASHHDPTFGAFPSHMKVDPTRSPLIYDSWPSGGTYGYLYPPQCHGCSNHDYFPDYNGFRPPYPHFPPPSPLHCHTSYPVYPGTYPFHYFPPPHYSVGQPRYEFDKNTPRDQHCCGCAHHTCDRKENFMKIAEQDPDAQNKSSDSLVPFKLKNHPYPVMWIPPGYMKNEEGRKPDDSKAKEGDKYQFDTSNWNGWLPVDINRLGSLKQGGDERKTEQQKNEDKNQFPFPLFWMPYRPEEVERIDSKKFNDGEETKKDFGVNPIKLPDNDDRKSQCRSHEGNYASEVGLKTVDSSGVKKVIPVKQAEHHQEKNISKDKESARGIIVEQPKENGGKKSSEDTSERQSNSQTKISKLPPVCLRVDPLPRRKSINGSSRSPSPPANKGKLLEASTDNLKSAVAKEKNLHGVESLNHVKKRTAVDTKRETNTIEVMEGTNKDEVEDCDKSQIRSVVNLPVDSREKVSNGQIIGEDGIHCEESFAKEDKGMGDTKDMNRVIAEVKKTTVEGESDDGECEIGEHKEARTVQEEKMDKANKVEKRFSDAEAVILIQAAYRGFEVRRWEPLKKLKQIAKITEQIPELKRRIQAFESSSDICSDDRQRVVIGETIMGFLLELDTIQGLHPSVRDIRKSVARELVTLQERLDVLADASAAKPVVDLSSNTRDDACIEQPKEGPEAKVGPGNNLPESGHEPLPMTGAMSESEAVESSNVIVAGKETCGDFEKKTAQLPVDDGGDSQMPDSQLLVVKNDEHKHVMSDCCDLLMSKTAQNNEVSDPEPSVELPIPLAAQEEIKSGVEVTDSSVDVDSTLKDKSADVIGFTELPQEILDRDPDALASESNKKIDLGKDTVMLDESPVDIGSDVKQVGPQLEELIIERSDSAELKIMLESDRCVKAADEVIGPEKMQNEVGKGDEAAQVTEVEQPLEGGPITVDEPEPVSPDTQKETFEEAKESRGSRDAVLIDNDGTVVQHTGSAKPPAEEEVVDEPEPVSPDIEKETFEEAKESRGSRDAVLIDNDGTVDLQTGSAKPAEEEVVAENEELPPLSAAPASQVSVGSDIMMERGRQAMEENVKLREMVEKLMEAGREQLSAISSLSGRVQDLEKQLSRKKKGNSRRYKARKSWNVAMKENVAGLEM